MKSIRVFLTVPRPPSARRAIAVVSSAGYETVNLNYLARRADSFQVVTTPAAALHSKLLRAARLRREEGAASLALAQEVAHDAMESGDVSVYCQALALQGQLLLIYGDLDQAFALAARIDTVSHGSVDACVTVAVEVFHAQLAFLLGSYRDAIVRATRAIASADANGDATLRAKARNETCFVLGSLDAPSVPELVAQRLALSQQNGDRWEEAMVHNDRACMAMARGAVDDALVEIALAEKLAATVEGPTLLLDSIIGTSRAEVLLADGRQTEATASVLAVLEALECSATPHPYLLGMAAGVAVRVLTAEGRIDDAKALGYTAVHRLGESMPLSRSAILATIADALGEAGRTDEAYAALSASVVLERGATRQFAELQRDLEQAVADHRDARVEADSLRDEADRDWLTGLHNRRYLARLPLAGAETVGIVLVDLDNFKPVNDTYGHDVGDRVLIRVTQLLGAAARADDTVVRLGGDEFVVVMIGADRGQAFACAHRLQMMLAEESWEFVGPSVSVGASVGYTSGPGSTPIDELLIEADRYLYDVKRSGRGQIAGTAHSD